MGQGCDSCSCWISADIAEFYRRSDYVSDSVMRFRVIRQGSIWGKVQILRAPSFEAALQWCMCRGYELIEQVEL